MEKNLHCGYILLLCAYSGIQLFVKDDATDADEARAFYRKDINPSKADIFSNSWGPKDNGYTTRGPRPLSAAALKLGTEEARRFVLYNKNI
jgi:hypothetical protein